jgi:hypothetical protein
MDQLPSTTCSRSVEGTRDWSQVFRGAEAKEQGFFEPERLRPPLDPAP